MSFGPSLLRRVRPGLGSALAIAFACVLGLPHGASSDERRGPVVRAVDKVGPAVVNISTEQVIESEQPAFPGFRDPFFEEFFRDFFEPRRRRMTRTSLGSGVIIRPDGYVLTNQHVILRGARIRVTLADEREFPATLAGTDSDSDLAVLKVDADRPLPVASIGNSDDLLIGETVIAIGNPFGLSHTVTTGVVSAVGRSVKGDQQTYYDFIQTDASINPGNSGGPLLIVTGDVVGINTAIYQKAQGIGFAIPINRARRIVDDLIAFGEVQPPWVGAEVQDLTEELATRFGPLPRRGVLVRAVEAGSPAAAAGIRSGDVITAIGERPIHSSAEYAQRIRDHAPGSEVRLTLWRDDRRQSLALRATTFPVERADALAWQRLGIRLRAARRWLEVTAVRTASPAARIGIAAGDAIIGLGGVTMTSMAAFRKKLIEVRSSQTVLVSVRRGRRIYHVTVPLQQPG